MRRCANSCGTTSLSWMGSVHRQTPPTLLFFLLTITPPLLHGTLALQWAIRHLPYRLPLPLSLWRYRMQEGRT